MVEAVFIDGEKFIVAIFKFLIKPVSGPKINVGIHKQLLFRERLMEIQANLFINFLDSVHLEGGPKAHLVLMVKYFLISGIPHDGSVGVDVHDAEVPIFIAVFFRF